MTENIKDLEILRRGIDAIDTEITELLCRRMEVSEAVADYKRRQGLPIFQKDRERALLSQAELRVPEKYRRGIRVLYDTIMDISKCLQAEGMTAGEIPPGTAPFTAKTVVCQGSAGSYSGIARKMLGFTEENGVTTRFVNAFGQVFNETTAGIAQVGLLPIENSSVGAVDLTYDLMLSHDFTIAAAVRVPIHHCLAVRNPSSEIKTVYSHEQALRQCSNYIARHGYGSEPTRNTAFAAEFVSGSEREDIAAICSKEAAAAAGLTITAEDISNARKNHTRFIAITKNGGNIANLPAGGGLKTVSLVLAVANTPSSLNKLLTRFSYCGLNLLRIQSRPVENSIENPMAGGTAKAPNVVFYLDFDGDINDRATSALLKSLSEELPYFRVLGCYNEFL